LCECDHAALELRDFLAFAVVGVDKIPRSEEIRNLISLCLGQLLDFIAKDNTGTVEEGRKSGIVSPCGHLFEERELISGLISEDEDVHDGVCRSRV
jgi:hypothetical protein